MISALQDPRGLALSVAALLAAGCAPETPADPPQVAGPCSPAWDDLPTDALYVDQTTGSGGDGTAAAPFEDVGSALDAARATGARTIAIAAGDYSPDAGRRTVALGSVWADDDLALVGCGVDDTTLVVIMAPPLGGDPGDPDELQVGVEISGLVQGLVVRDLTVRGGLPAIIVREGAGSEREIVLRRVRVEEADRNGVVISGLDTQALLEDVQVEEVTPLPGGLLGYGIAVQAGGSVWDQPTGVISIVGGSIRDAYRVGLLVDRSNVDVLDLVVEDTQPDEGMLGRGIQIQNNAVAVLTSVVSTRNSDAAVFLHMPLDVTLDGCTLSETARGTIPGHEDEPSGDGLSVTRGPPSSTSLPWTVTLIDNVFADNGRAGAIVEGVAVIGPTGGSFSGNQIVTDGETFPLAPDQDGLLLQDGATATGDATNIGADSGFPGLEMYRTVLDGG